MIQEVKFQGLYSSPSDYEAQDGELGTCLNLIYEDGALKPIPKPVVVDAGITLTDGASVEYIHKVSHGGEIHSHYIIRRKDGTWCWTEKGGTGTLNEIELGGFYANSVTAVGNVVSFVGEDSIKYLYWMGDRYQIFDKDNFNFKITLRERELEPFYVDVGLGDDFDNYVTYGSDKNNKRIITGMSAEKVVKTFNLLDAYVNKEISNKGKGWQKYFVFGVAAIRLYDGTYFNVSNIFRLSVDDDYFGTDASTLSFFNINEDDKRFHLQTIYLARWSVMADIPNLDKISNFVQGIDIFLTKAESFINFANNAEYKTTEGEAYSGKMSFSMMNGRETANAIDGLPFFHSLFISKDELNKELDMERVEGTEESISLASLNRSDVGGKCAVTYNNRLHLANIREGYASNIISDIYEKTSKDDNVQENECFIHVKTYNRDLWYKDDYLNSKLLTFISIPILDVDSVSFFRKTGDSSYDKATVNLHSSDTTAFSFYVSGEGGFTGRPVFDVKFEDSTEDEWNDAWDEYEENRRNDNSVPSYSLIKVSEAENPLVFPAKNSVQVGSSVIQAIAANTRPISEGQFGEAPLYAFTDEGVWVLMTGSTGTYEARQPANREICSNPESVLQIDDAVLFPTERGIMMQQGRESVCITDALDGEPFDFTQLYKEDYAKEALAFAGIPEYAVKYTRFRDYLKGADMIYDYYDSRIILFNPSHTYAYVYSLKSKMWGTMESDISKRVNDYPDAYAVNKSGHIVNLYDGNPSADVRYFLCSRPLALSGNEVYKTMFTCITRGYFRGAEKGKCGMLLYGSNDLFHWLPVKTSVSRFLRGMAGSPYKYFRIALVGNLSADESISGLSAYFQERWQNKLR